MARPTPAQDFGKWFQGLRKRAAARQTDAAKAAGVSEDSVKRIERGEMVGTQHFFPLMSWLASAHPDLHDDIEQQLVRWILRVGDRLREEKAGVKRREEAAQPKKAAHG